MRGAIRQALTPSGQSDPCLGERAFGLAATFARGQAQRQHLAQRMLIVVSGPGKQCSLGVGIERLPVQQRGGSFKLRRLYRGFRSNREDHSGDTAFAERDSDPRTRLCGTAATLGREVVKSASQGRGYRAAPDRRFDGSFRGFLAQGLLGTLTYRPSVLKPGSGRIPCCYRGGLWYDPRSFSHDRC